MTPTLSACVCITILRLTLNVPIVVGVLVCLNVMFKCYFVFCFFFFFSCHCSHSDVPHSECYARKENKGTFQTIGGRQSDRDRESGRASECEKEVTKAKERQIVK